MSDDQESIDLLPMTAEIVAAHVANNSVHASEVPKLIAAIHGALAALGTSPEPEPVEPEYKPAVSVRKSTGNDQYLISLIDGKPYKTLRRHLRAHGLTDRDYRARYDLPADYPMVAKAYSAARSAMARTIGLGRQAGEKVIEAAAGAEQSLADAVAPAVTKARNAAAAAVGDGAPAPKRGRKPGTAAKARSTRSATE